MTTFSSARQGEKVAPADVDPKTYWDNVIAGRIKHSMPKDGTKRSVTDLLKSQGFSDDELRALKRVIDATAEMNEIEKIAFAATQGLYDPETKKTVEDGPPRLDFASKLVNSNEYNVLKANLSTAVTELVAMTDRRTSAEVEVAGTGARALDPAFAVQHGSNHRHDDTCPACRPTAGAGADSSTWKRRRPAGRGRLRDADGRPAGRRGTEQRWGARSIPWRNRSRTTSAGATRCRRSSRRRASRRKMRRMRSRCSSPT